jgi:pilus assembly protein CpaD
MRIHHLALLALTGLASCADVLEGPPPAVNYDQIYPISLRQGTVRLEVDAARAVLMPEQENAIRAFASRALSTGARYVLIGHPDTTPGNAVAARVSQILITAGVSPEVIRAGKADGPMVVASFASTVAVSKPCGQWTADAVAKNYTNNPGSDFGCATQQNLAAMVARPTDLVIPRAPALRVVNGLLEKPATTAAADTLVK